MTRITQTRRGWISGTRQRLNPALMFAAMLLPIFLSHQAAHAQTYSVLYTFKGPPDGENPVGSLVRDTAGNLYGTTSQGGDPNCPPNRNCGVVFKLDRTGHETLLYSFTGNADGGGPTGALVRDGQGNLYGTTFTGGDLNCFDTFGCGVVFKLDTNGTETVLHTFAGKADGASPYADMIRDSDGNLYDTANQGGDTVDCEHPFGCGTIFKLNRRGGYTVLHTFTGPPDGGHPYAGLVWDPEGNFYGTTLSGGIHSAGTVFKVGKTGKYTVLYNFAASKDGGYPWGSLILDAAGNLYGTTNLGGIDDRGTVFKLNSTTGKFMVLHRFNPVAEGAGPRAGVVRGSNGNLYGTTTQGGDTNCLPPSGCGTIFKLSRTGKYTVLHTFAGAADGGGPWAGLVLDSRGKLYGTTNFGGDNTACAPYGCGVVFKLTP
jgi:uncharacterized repeat protein (TIGR03803 family)